MPDFAVDTAFTASDRVTRALDKMDRSVDRFGKSAGRSFKMASKGALGFRSVMKGILAAGAVSKVLQGLSRGLRAVSTDFLDFNQNITSAAAKFKDVNLQTAEGRAKFEALKKSARDIGATTEFSAAQAAAGLKFMSLAGFDSAQAMANLKNLTNLATSSEIDLGRASDIATDSLGAFGLMTKDSNQLQKNFTRQNDVMAKVMAKSNVGAEDFFETVKRSAATFTASGQKLETFGTLTGIMADAGKKGGDAGTVLNNMMLKLAKPTGDAARALDLMGVKTADSQGNFRDIVDILADVQKGTKDMGTQQRAATLDLIFGKRAITGVNILLKKGIPEIRAYREELNNSAGSSKKMADIMRGSLTNQLKGLQSAAIEVGFQLFEAFSGKGSSAIRGLTEIVRGIDLTPFIETVKGAFELVKQGIDFIISKGTESGFFANVKNLIVNDLMPVMNQLWDLAKNVFKFLNAAGVFDGMLFALNLVVEAVRLVVKVVGGLAKILSPIFENITSFIKFADKILSGPAGNLEAASAAQKAAPQSFGGIGGNIKGQFFAKQEEEQTPQQTEAEARAKQLTLNQKIDITSPTPGATADVQTTAAPQLAYAGFGANARFGR